MLFENDLIKIRYNENEITNILLDKYINSLNIKLPDILNKLNACNVKININLLTKSELDDYVQKNSVSYLNRKAPSWLVGFSSNIAVCIVYPTEDNLNENIDTTLHECVHYLMYNTCYKACHLKIIDEGLAEYLSRQTSLAKLEEIKYDMRNNNMKNISFYTNCDIQTFAKNNGYIYSYYIMEFLIKNYGIEKIIYWYKNENDFLKEVSEKNLDSLFEKYVLTLL